MTMTTTTRDPPGAAAVDRDLLLLLTGLSSSQSSKTGLYLKKTSHLLVSKKLSTFGGTASYELGGFFLLILVN